MKKFLLAGLALIAVATSVFFAPEAMADGASNAIPVPTASQATDTLYSKTKQEESLWAQENSNDVLANHASDPSDPGNSADPLNKTYKNDYSEFLKPGYHFLISPGVDQGQSISAVYDGEGFVICISQQNGSDSDIPPGFSCNNRKSGMGIHIPAPVLFGDTGKGHKFKTILEFLAVAGPMGAASFSQLGVGSEGSSATNSEVQGSPRQQVISEHDASKALKAATLDSKDEAAPCEGSFASAPSGAYMADIVNGLENRIRGFLKDCDGYNKKYPNIDQLNADVLKKNPYILYCHEQNYDQWMAQNIVAICGIQPVPAAPGETAASQLWYPGAKLPESCVTTLKAYGKTDSSGNPVLTSDPALNAKGWNVSFLGAPYLKWADHEVTKLQGITPGTIINVAANKAADCVANKPGVTNALKAEALNLEGDPATQSKGAPASSPSAPTTPTQNTANPASQ